MINLNAIVQSAQGGQAVDNLSARFGLTPTQTQSAIDAVLPALKMGLQNRLESGDVGGLLGHLGSGVHQQAYQDGTAAQSGTVASQGGSILGELFGGAGTTTAVVQQAAASSGVSAAVIQAMLPVIASIVMGGLSHGMQTGGFGGLLSSVLGSLLGGSGAGVSPGSSPMPNAPPPPAPDQGGLGGLFGSVLGGLFGGGQEGPGGGTSQASPAQTGSAASTLQELSSMFESGSAASPEHKAALADILGR